MLSHTDINNQMTSWSYDTLGRPTLETRPDGNKIATTYAYCSGVAGGSATCPTYGAYRITVTPYQSNGSTQNGAATRTYFDKLNRVIASDMDGFDGTNTRTATEYDSKLRVYRVSRPYFCSMPCSPTVYWTTNSAIDDLGRVTTLTQPDSSTTTFTFSGLTKTVTVRPDGNSAHNQTSTTVTNDEGLVDHVTDASSNSTYYTYDAFGNLKTVTDPLGNVVTNTYDTRGRKTASSDPDLGSWQYEYDVLSELVKQTDAKSQLTTLEYDVLGRLVLRDESGLYSTWTYGEPGSSDGDYNAGKLIRAKACTSSSCSTVVSDRTFEFDPVGRPLNDKLAIEGTTYTTDVTYDTNGHIDTVSYPRTSSDSNPRFKVQYSYNTLGYPNQLKEYGGTYAYWTADVRDAELHLMQSTFKKQSDGSTAFTATNGYDPYTGLITSVQAGPSYNVANLAYTWDQIGNLLTRVDSYNSVTDRFCYDALNRLTSYSVNLAACDSSGAKTVAYNAIGNITKKTDVCNTTDCYTYPSSGSSSVRPHAVTSIANCSGCLVDASNNPSYHYDANGNQDCILAAGQSTCSAGTPPRKITYTSFNLASQIVQSTTTVDFKYDSEHARIKQVRNSSETTYYLNDSISGVMSEKLVSGSTDTWHDYLTVGGQTIGERSKVGTGGATVNYFVSDHLGSIAAITDSSGTVSERLSYDAWGRRRNSNGTDNATCSITSSTTRGYTFQEHMPDFCTINYNARIYNPTVGRFMAADPVASNPLSTQGFNRYAYVGNNPLNATDPTGMEACIGGPGNCKIRIYGPHQEGPRGLGWVSIMPGFWTEQEFDGDLEGDRSISSAPASQQQFLISVAATTGMANSLPTPNASKSNGVDTSHCFLTDTCHTRQFDSGYRGGAFYPASVEDNSKPGDEKNAPNGAMQLPLWYNEVRSGNGWAVNWAFDKLPADGFVVQEIEIMVLDPAGNVVRSLGTAYEYWPVQQGSTQTLFQTEIDRGRYARGPDDRFGQVRSVGASGTLSVSASASLWVNVNVPRDAYGPTGPRTTGAFPPSQSLQSSYFQPPTPLPNPALSVTRGYSQPLR